MKHAMRLLPLTVLCLRAGASPEPSGPEILEKVQANLSSSNRVFTSRMVIHGRRGTRTVRSRTWAVGETKAYTEYLFPPREAGTKMLKLDDRLWLYTPSADRTLLISGHMLRQSVMGSDLSYEDMMEDPRLAESYEAVRDGTETLDGQRCWILALTARRQDLAYHKRRMWVDAQRFIPLREELYARGGRLLKRTELSDIRQVQGRWFPTRIVFRDMLRSGGGTSFVIETIAFDQPIDPARFNKASLR
jgi:outer membrane lipoprotein-sorting protein